MKIVNLLTAAFIVGSGLIQAQKIGVVDTNYILNQLPQFKEAEQRLSSQVAAWEKEIQTLQTDYTNKKTALENERVLLVGEQLKQREKEVDDLDKKIKTILNSRFGAKGEINNTRANLAKPFQDQIWNAINTISQKNTLGIVLDKNDNNVLFLEKRYDYTEKVLNLLLKSKPETSSPKKGAGSPQDGGSSARERAVKGRSETGRASAAEMKQRKVKE